MLCSGLFGFFNKYKYIKIADSIDLRVVTEDIDTAFIITTNKSRTGTTQ